MFKDFVEAINEYIEAKQEHDKALKEYKGYSWDWAGGFVIEAMESAEKKMQECFNAAVDARVQELKELDSKSERVE